MRIGSIEKRIAGIGKGSKVRNWLGGIALIVAIYILISSHSQNSNGEPIENEFIYLGRQLDEIEKKIDKISRKLNI